LFLLVAEQLSHKFPKVRKLMADKFYVFLMTNGEELFSESRLDDITNFITDSLWLDERLDIKTIKEEFYKLLHLEDKKTAPASAA